MNKYSLKDLAWLSRCLFPVNFYEKLLELGFDRDDAYCVAALSHPAHKDDRPKNILDVYQGCLCTHNEEWKKKSIEMLHAFIDDFLKKD